VKTETEGMQKERIGKRISSSEKQQCVPLIPLGNRNSRDQGGSVYMRVREEC